MSRIIIRILLMFFLVANLIIILLSEITGVDIYTKYGKYLLLILFLFLLLITIVYVVVSPLGLVS